MTVDRHDPEASQRRAATGGESRSDQPAPSISAPDGDAEIVAAFSRLWRPYSDDQLCRVLAATMDSGCSVISETALRIWHGWLPDRAPDFESILALSCALVVGLVEEAQRRRTLNESPVGAVVTRWIARGPAAVTDDDLRLLRRASEFRHRRHPDGVDELNAIRNLAITSSVREIEDLHFADTLEGQFRRVIAGGFNYVPRRADNRVRDYLRHVWQWRSSEVSDSALVERISSPRTNDSNDRRDVPVDEWIRRANLTAQERAVIRRRLRNLTQVAIAMELHITQARVSKLERTATQKLQRAVVIGRASTDS